MARKKPEPDPSAAESFSGIEGADPTAEDFVPKWLAEQNKASQVPINQYAEYQAANFGDPAPELVDAVHGAGTEPDSAE